MYYHRTYDIYITNSKTTAKEIFEDVARNFYQYTIGVSYFEKIKGDPSKIAVGDEYMVISGPKTWLTGNLLYNTIDLNKYNDNDVVFGGTKSEGSPNYNDFYNVLRNGIVGGENEETLENLNLDKMTFKSPKGVYYNVDIGKMRSLVASNLRVLMGQKDVTGGSVNWAGGKESEDYVLKHHIVGTIVTKITNIAKGKNGYTSYHYFYQLGASHPASAAEKMKTRTDDENKQ